MRPMPELRVEEAPTRELLPYANNAKIRTSEQVEQICASIEEFGFNDPVAVWDGPEGTEIVEGHGRVIAAKKLGLETLPIIRLDHLSDEQRRAYTHVHNQLTMNTGWDLDKLSAELGELDFDFEWFGFPGEEQKESAANAVDGMEGVEEFAEALDIKHDYIVLMFNTEEDFDWAAQRLGVKRANQLQVGSRQVRSKGRVLDGVEALVSYEGNR